VKEFYSSGCRSSSLETPTPGYIRACECPDDDALCPDPGLPDNLFRGSRIIDGKKVVVKAVHPCSREYDIIRLLSTPPLRYEPMNHTIPVIDFVEIIKDNVVFIVMEEWSPQLITDPPCCLKGFLGALRQCIEHVVFMHRHRTAHLDISPRNIVTDYKGHYAYIDYEASRRFDGTAPPLVFGYRGTEVPPECERNEWVDPYKVDIWAMAVLMLRACKLAGYHVPELMHVIKPMLHEVPSRRPSIRSVLLAFDCMLSMMGDRRLASDCSNPH